MRFLFELGRVDGYFSAPSAVAISNQDIVFVADCSEHRIQAFDADSGRFRFAWGRFGSGKGEFKQPCGLAFNGPGNRIYVADTGNNRIQVFTTDGDYEGAFDSAGSPAGRLDEPRGLAFDAKGNLYVADAGGRRVQIFDAGGDYVGVINSPSFHPIDVAVDGEGNIYVADSDSDAVLKFDADIQYDPTWRLSTSVNLGTPLSVAVGSSKGDEVILVSSSRSTIQLFEANGSHLETWGSPRHPLGFKPASLATGPGGRILVTSEYTVHTLDRRGKPQGQFGSDQGVDGQLRRPGGIAVDRSGHIYVGDTGNQRVQKFDDRGNWILTTVTVDCQGLSIGAGGNIFVARTVGASPVVLDAAGNPISSSLPLLLPGVFTVVDPTDIAVDAAGTIFVAVTGENAIKVLDSQGSLMSTWTRSATLLLNRPKGIALGLNDDVYVADTLNDRIVRFSKNGNPLDEWGTGGSGNGQFNAPEGVAVDAVGNVLVADTGNDRIQIFDQSGGFLGILAKHGSGQGQVIGPRNLAVSRENILYVAETSPNINLSACRANNRVQAFAL